MKDSFIPSNTDYMGHQIYIKDNKDKSINSISNVFSVIFTYKNGDIREFDGKHWSLLTRKVNHKF